MSQPPHNTKTQLKTNTIKFGQMPTASPQLLLPQIHSHNCHKPNQIRSNTHNKLTATTTKLPSWVAFSFVGHPKIERELKEEKRRKKTERVIEKKEKGERNKIIFFSICVCVISNLERYFIHTKIFSV